MVPVQRGRCEALRDALGRSFWGVTRAGWNEMSNMSYGPRFQTERKPMNPDHYVSLLIGRAADARAMIMFFALFHTGILIVLGFGGSGLEDSGVQLALAAVAVLEDFASSNLGRRFDNVPVGVFRVVNLVVIALIVIAEVLAIY